MIKISIDLEFLPKELSFRDSVGVEEVMRAMQEESSGDPAYMISLWDLFRPGAPVTIHVQRGEEKVSWNA